MKLSHSKTINLHSIYHFLQCCVLVIFGLRFVSKLISQVLPDSVCVPHQELCRHIPSDSTSGGLPCSWLMVGDTNLHNELAPSSLLSCMAQNKKALAKARTGLKIYARLSNPRNNDRPSYLWFCRYHNLHRHQQHLLQHHPQHGFFYELLLLPLHQFRLLWQHLLQLCSSLS